MKLPIFPSLSAQVFQQKINSFVVLRKFVGSFKNAEFQMLFMAGVIGGKPLRFPLGLGMVVDFILASGFHK